MLQQQSLGTLVLLGGCLAVGFTIATLVTHEWILVKVLDTKFLSVSLWKYCVAERCVVDVSAIPMGLAAGAAGLAVFSLVAAALMIYLPRFSSKAMLLPIAGFFASAVLLLMTLAFIWTEMPQRNYLKMIPNISGLLPSLKNSALSSIVSGSNLNLEQIGSLIPELENFNLANLAQSIPKNAIALEYGFSGIFLLTAAPLLILCSIVLAFIAAFRMAKAQANNIYPAIAHANNQY